MTPNNLRTEKCKECKWGCGNVSFNDFPSYVCDCKCHKTIENGAITKCTFAPTDDLKEEIRKWFFKQYTREDGLLCIGKYDTESLAVSIDQVIDKVRLQTELQTRQEVVEEIKGKIPKMPNGKIKFRPVTTKTSSRINGYNQCLTEILSILNDMGK